MQRVITSILLLVIFNVTNAQIAFYNQFPTNHNVKEYPLDTNTDNLSFAVSMRLLYTGYSGNIIKLRRSSDNVEKDFKSNGLDLYVDTVAIRSWANGSDLYVVKWYDQSNKDRHFIQATQSKQPRLKLSVAPTFPYIEGDGVDDGLICDTSLQVLTNAGKEGTLLGVFKSSIKNQYSCGSFGTNSWHITINNSSATNPRTRFSPGTGSKDFKNTLTNWQQLSFIRKANDILIRQNGVDKVNSSFSGAACNSTHGFAICRAANRNSNYATTKFQELILWDNVISEAKYKAIEANQKIFFGL